jgi:hypothetical protein
MCSSNTLEKACPEGAGVARLGSSLGSTAKGLKSLTGADIGAAGAVSTATTNSIWLSTLWLEMISTSCPYIWMAFSLAERVSRAMMRLSSMIYQSFETAGLGRGSACTVLMTLTDWSSGISL